MLPRTWEPRERRLVSEWTRLAFPNAHVKEAVRLGALDSSLQDANLTPPELRALGVWRRWCDAVVIEPARVHLVEGKIRNAHVALVELELYRRLFPLTPEFAEVRHLPLERHLVWVVPDPVVESMAREQGVHVHTYHPAWVDDYFKLLQARERRPPAPRGLPSLFTSETTEEEP